MRGNIYQVTLIILGVVVTVLFGMFLYREIYPEYRIYQNDYVALEEFRSQYTGEPVPPFVDGIKQIVIEPEDKGPAFIDRCVSCHVATKLPHFSPTRIKKDLNGNIVYDENGLPEKEPNPDYIWGLVDQKIAELTDEAVIKQLQEQGNSYELRLRKEQAKKLEELKVAHVGHNTWDVTKVLQMHPLIGRETRPFEFHPLEEYGCTSCHSGNGRGLTTEKAHGPVFDEEYEIAKEGPKPVFLEKDEENDPQFSRVFNAKPGHTMLFQTTPLYVGSLIQAKCMNCHQSSADILSGALNKATLATERRSNRSKVIQKGYIHEEEKLQALTTLYKKIEENGYKKAIEELTSLSKNYTLPERERLQAETQLTFLQENDQDQIKNQLIQVLGDEQLVTQFLASDGTIQNFIEQHIDDPTATGSLFKKYAAVNLEKELLRHVSDTEESFEQSVKDQKNISAMISDIDFLTKEYHRGQELYLSQACYACHRITGFARGGVGPELTRIGNHYPWYIKESMVWPQADLKTSTMPNYRLDHEELEYLMTFMLAQKGENRTISPTGYKVAVQNWEAGKKQSWEKPITPAMARDLRYSMTVFATEGCAACHRLKGFESNVGFAIEKGKKPTFEELFEEREWFNALFPEEIRGSEIVTTIEKNANVIDQRIIHDVRENSIIEEIEEKQPQAIESLYSNFKYALRAKNAEYQQHDDGHKKLKEWQDRVRRVLKIYVQEYGLGRLIGPRPNWSGVYRTDKWLMEHFRAPSAHVARSIMPVMPFDETKYYALTYMLDVLAKKNRDQVREIWYNNGFNAERAYQIFCSQCHGEYMQGNGPVSEWIYPIPKNLRNAEFLRNLTRERVKSSIVHGVKGTPMPSWGEVAEDKPTADGIPVLTDMEIERLVDWIFTSLPGARVIRESEDVPKWQYDPQDILRELQREGGILNQNNENTLPPELSALPKGKGYLASLTPALQADEIQVEDVFERVIDEDTGEEKFYIKEKYYTPENITQGRNYFQLNCSICHGTEGDGTGFRAGTMHDAKPRMLINLDWSGTRDDLRLLRSIKFGVAGTSMSPWGDLTTSHQRMQLVMFIRTLTKKQRLREQLFSALYKAYDEAEQTIEVARVDDFIHIAATEALLQEANDQRQKIYQQIQEGKASPSDGANVYQEELALVKKIQQLRNSDQIYLEMKKNITEEKGIFQNIGVTLLSLKDQEKVFNEFVKLLNYKDDLYSLVDGKLTLNINPTKQQEVMAFGKKILDVLSKQINELQSRKIQVEGRITSPDRNEKLDLINLEIRSVTNLRNKMITGLEESKRILENQQLLLAALQKTDQQS